MPSRKRRPSPHSTRLSRPRSSRASLSGIPFPPQSDYGQIVGLTPSGVGIEGETTVALGHGIRLYGNGSLNVAKNRATGQPIANAPEATWALGALYNNGPFGASLINKWVGSRYGDTGLKQGLEPFNQLDAAVHYTIQRPHLPPINLKLQVNNVIDSRKIIEFDLYAGSKSTPIYFTPPGRSAFFSIEVPI